MGDQAEALNCPIHVISSIETGNTPLPSDYLNRLKQWLQLNDGEHTDLLKRAPGIVVDFRPRNSTSNRSTNMRLFRKVRPECRPDKSETLEKNYWSRP